MSKIPFIKAKHAQMKLIEGGGGGGTSLVLIGLVVYIPPDTYEYPVDEPIMYNGMVLMAQYEDNYYRDVTDIATYSIPKGTVMTDDYEGEVTFTYEEGGVKVQNSIEISVVSGVTWTSSKASKLVEAFAAAYAGDTEILSKLAVGDIREVKLQDGNTAHLILAKANPTTFYKDTSGTSGGTAKFIVTMQEAYPYGEEPQDFISVLPEDLQPLFKYHRYTEYYDCDGSYHYSRIKYEKAFYPNYTFFTTNISYTPYSGRISYGPVATDTIDLRQSAGGYYDSNPVDTSGDVFAQSNRIFRNIFNPDEYIQNVAGRGYSRYSTNFNYWYMNNPTYYCAENYGKSAYQNNETYIKGYTYCMLI